MEYERFSDPRLRLRFSFVDERLAEAGPFGPSSTEIRDFFGLLDDVTHSVVEHEALSLIDTLDLPSNARLKAMRRVSEAPRDIAAASFLVAVQPGSLIVEILISATEVVTAVAAIIGAKVVEDVWLEAPVHKKVQLFFAQAFRGARLRAEETAVTRRPARSGVRTEQVEELPGVAGEDVIEIVVLRVPTRTSSKKDWAQAEELVRRVLRG